MVFLLISFMVATCSGLLQRQNTFSVNASSTVFQGDLTLGGSSVTVIEGQFDINGSIIVENNATLILRNALVNFPLTYHSQFNMSFQNPASGNPRLIVENASISSNNYYMPIYLFGNSSADITQLVLKGDLNFPYPAILFYNNSTGAVRDSTMAYVPAMGDSVLKVYNCTIDTIGGFDNSTVSAVNCTLQSLDAGENASVTSANSTVGFAVGISTVDLNYSFFGLKRGFFDYWSFEANCTVAGESVPRLTLLNTYIGNWSFISEGCSLGEISHSEIMALRLLNSSNTKLFGVTTGWLITHDNASMDVYDSRTDWIFTYNDSRISLINSSCVVSYCPIRYDQSQVAVYWYLDVYVTDSIDQKVNLANVTAVFSNATVAQSVLTDEKGHARLTLLEKMRNATGQYFLGSYTVTATFGDYTNSTAIAIQGNEELTLMFSGLVVPEFQYLVLSLVVAATVVVIMIRVAKRKQRIQTQKPTTQG